MKRASRGCHWGKIMWHEEQEAGFATFAELSVQKTNQWLERTYSCSRLDDNFWLA